MYIHLLPFLAKKYWFCFSISYMWNTFSRHKLICEKWKMKVETITTCFFPRRPALQMAVDTLELRNEPSKGFKIVSRPLQAHLFFLKYVSLIWKVKESLLCHWIQHMEITLLSYYTTGCSIWIATKVNEWCDYVFQVKTLFSSNLCWKHVCILIFGIKNFQRVPPMIWGIFHFF